MNKFSIFVVVLSGLLRLVPHPFGVTPIHAAGLFAGSTLSLRQGIPLYLAMIVVSDAFIGFYDVRVMIAVYVGALAAPLVGKWIIGAQRTGLRIAGGVGVSSLVFYAISNFGNWWAYYPHTWAGLVANYIAGLPFLGYSLLGTGLYAVVIFGSHGLIERYRFAAKEAHVQ